MISEVHPDLSCRAAVYRLLARLWSRELDAATVDELQDSDVATAYRAVGGDLPDATDDEALESLATDFCQLFLGPSGHLPPYQSVWVDGKLDGASAASFRKYLDLFDSPPQANAMPDHLATQLEVMACVLDHLHAAPSESTSIRQLASDFFVAHIAWAVPLCQTAAERATTSTYRTMCQLTREFIEEELRELQSA